MDSAASLCLGVASCGSTDEFAVVKLGGGGDEEDTDAEEEDDGDDLVTVHVVWWKDLYKGGCCVEGACVNNVFVKVGLAAYDPPFTLSVTI